jgi:hypothetical protein
MLAAAWARAGGGMLELLGDRRAVVGDGQVRQRDARQRGDFPAEAV